MEFRPEFNLEYDDLCKISCDLEIVQSNSEGDLGESRVFRKEWIHKIIIK